jgi:gliding motility-associated-like protein
VRAASCEDGTADISVTAPLGAEYEYSLDGGDYQSSVDFTGVPSGEHTLSVRRTGDASCGSGANFTLEHPTVDLTMRCPESVNVECGEPIDPESTGFPVMLTGCGEAAFTYVDSELMGGCSASTGSFTRTFTGIDGMGNQATCVQTITVNDTTAPVFEGNIAEVLFVDCDETVDVVPPIFTDNCCNDVTLDFTEREVIDGTCTIVKKIVRTWVATDECGNESTFEQVIHFMCEVKVFNAVSPNGNGLNDIFYLEGIECYPNNNVKIFNRWGVLVFETDNYDNANNVFRGISDGRATIGKNKGLPSGDYFYILEYRSTGVDGTSGRTMRQSGHLYISN